MCQAVMARCDVGRKREQAWPPPSPAHHPQRNTLKTTVEPGAFRTSEPGAGCAPEDLPGVPTQKEHSTQRPASSLTPKLRVLRSNLLGLESIKGACWRKSFLQLLGQVVDPAILSKRQTNDLVLPRLAAPTLHQKAQRLAMFVTVDAISPSGNRWKN